MSDKKRTLTNREKALQVNLDNRLYGSFAEIGAGQETAANFFKVGGASGTIAKTMSAYDMKFSDVIYGKSKRYVSEERLKRMLDRELRLLTERLDERAPITNFFSFANTVEILNFHRTNQGHGWLGLKFQRSPKGSFNECAIHVLLHENSLANQQYAIGVLGVNLIHACFYEEDSEKIMLALLDNITPKTIEVDCFKLSGTGFASVDNRVLALKLVKNKLTSATMFDENGAVQQPKEALYKKDLLLFRGRFRPPTHVHVDMIESAHKVFQNKLKMKPNTVITMAELTLQNLTVDQNIDEQDFLNRVDILASMGLKVLISDYAEYFKLMPYITRTTKEKVGLVMGIGTLESLFNESYYENLSGGILESFGSLFKKNITIFVYPTLKLHDASIYTCSNLVIPSNLKSLFTYLLHENKIRDLPHSSTDHLNIFSDHTIKMIQNHEKGWEEKVPHIVEKAIKEKGLWGYGE